VSLAKLHRGADVTGREMPRIRAVLPLDREDLADLFRALRARIPDFLAGRQISGEDPDHREVARVRFAAGLEHERRERRAHLGLQVLLDGAARPRGVDRAHVDGRRGEIDERVEQEVDPEHRDRGDGKGRHEGAMGHSFA
jgi:hypothetical protein